MRERHHADPLTAEQREIEDRNAIEFYAKRRKPPAKKGDRLWMETTYCGTWCGTYRLGDYSHSSRYQLVHVFK